MSVFDFDHQLPALPLPELAATCELLKKAIRPLTDEAAARQTAEAIDDFAGRGGLGEQLQERLLERRGSLPGNSSWLRPFWDDSYLTFRDRLPINMNYIFQLDGSQWPGAPLLSLIRGMTLAILALRRETLPPETGKDGPLSMDTLRSLIYTRIAGPVRDTLLLAPLAAPPTAAVVCRGFWFSLTLTYGQEDPLSAEDLAAALAEIRRQAAALAGPAGAPGAGAVCGAETNLTEALPGFERGPARTPGAGAVPVGALTCAPRDQAFALRSRLLERPLNRLNLNCIEQACFVICLDEPAADGAAGADGAGAAGAGAGGTGGSADADADGAGGDGGACSASSGACPAAALLGGDPANRWFERSLQIIALPNGELGLNIEHSGCDASIWIYLTGQALRLARQAAADQAAPTPAPAAQAAPTPAAPAPAAQSAPAPAPAALAATAPTPVAQAAAPTPTRRPPSPQHLAWDIPADLAADLAAARRDFLRLTADLSVAQRTIPALARNILKETGHSPDSVLQIACQMAYYRLTGAFRSVYEAISTRGFYQGRTECARPCTEESQAFVLAWAEGKTADSALRELFSQAVKAHQAGIRRGQGGLGPERHMAGLKAIYDMYARPGQSGAGGQVEPDERDAPDRRDEPDERSRPGEAAWPRPAVFDAPGYRALRWDTMSTSNVTAPFITCFAFGPVVPDGLGIGYGLGQDALRLAATAYPAGGVDPEAFIAATVDAALALLTLGVSKN
ncbi:MAG: choline/carnitine O-acyltransferase [Peptococcaceae bacterium]|jgi:carnitine O-acetyltransferase|nr:choline/carnitine O-acyltransferase [Peptococcaceae bacterium]